MSLASLARPPLRQRRQADALKPFDPLADRLGDPREAPRRQGRKSAPRPRLPAPNLLRQRRQGREPATVDRDARLLEFGLDYTPDPLGRLDRGIWRDGGGRELPPRELDRIANAGRLARPDGRPAKIDPVFRPGRDAGLGGLRNLKPLFGPEGDGETGGLRNLKPVFRPGRDGDTDDLRREVFAPAILPFLGPLVPAIAEAGSALLGGGLAALFLSLSGDTPEEAPEALAKRPDRPKTDFDPLRPSQPSRRTVPAENIPSGPPPTPDRPPEGFEAKDKAPLEPVDFQIVPGASLPDDIAELGPQIYIFPDLSEELGQGTIVESRGNAETQAEIIRIQKALMAANPLWTHIAGGWNFEKKRKSPEQALSGYGKLFLDKNGRPGDGRLGSRFPDLTFVLPNGEKIAVNTVDVDKNDKPTENELAAARDMRLRAKYVILIPKAHQLKKRGIRGKQ